MATQDVSFIRWDPKDHRVIWSKDFNESRKSAYREWAKKSYNYGVISFLESLEKAYHKNPKDHSSIQNVYETHLSDSAKEENSVIVNNKKTRLHEWNRKTPDEKLDTANKIALDIVLRGDLQSQMIDFKNAEKQGKQPVKVEHQKYTPHAQAQTRNHSKRTSEPQQIIGQHRKPRKPSG